MRLFGQQVLVLVARGRGRRRRNACTRSCQPARRLERQPADAEIAGHHALAGEHLEDPQDLFALAEAVEEHRHRADVDGVRAQPDQVRC